MITRILLLVGVAVVFVNCTNKGSQKYSRSVLDTPVIITSATGQTLEVIQPSVPADLAEAPAPSPEELDLQNKLNQVWAESGFNEQILMGQFIGPDICSLSEKQFVGCFFAAQEMSSMVDGEDTVLVVDGQQDELFVGEKLRTIGLFAVHQRPELPTLLRADLVGRSERRRLEVEFFKQTVDKLKELYQQRLAPREDVQYVIQLFRTNYVEAIERLQTAQMQLSPVVFEQARDHYVSVLNLFGGVYQQMASQNIYQDYLNLAEQAFATVSADKKAIVAGTIYNTYLRHSADGHAGLMMDPNLERQLSASADEVALYGIGVFVIQDETDPSQLYFEPRENSSALRAGVQSNDRLISVNGTTPVDLQQAIDLIKGPRDTEVTIVVERWSTKEQVNLVIARQPITIKNFEGSLKAVHGKTYGVLKVSTFMDTTVPAELSSYITNNDAQVDGWILDLRGNGGGRLDFAVNMIGMFVPKNTPTVGRSDENHVDVLDPRTVMPTRFEPLSTKKLLVLVDGSSASASEVVSGVLQEHHRAYVVGQRTFGKGSMQTPGQTDHPELPGYRVWTQFKDIFYKKTTGRYFYASGRTPEWVGVEPDFSVQKNPDVEELYSPREADLVPFSMGDVGERWIQSREVAIAQIQTCIDSSGSETKKWSHEESTKPFAMDYQMLFSLDALVCM